MKPVTRDDPSLQAWAALMEAQSSVVEGVEAELLAETDLPLAWHEVLVRLARADDGAMRMQELARSVLLSKSGLTRLADRMQRAGLIERRSCPSDRRGTLAVVTDRGRVALDRAAPVFLRAVDAHFARHLGVREMQSLRQILRKVTTGNGRQGEDECAPEHLGPRPATSASIG